MKKKILCFGQCANTEKHSMVFIGFQTHSGGLGRKQCRLGGCAGRARCLRVRSGQTISARAGF